MRVRGLRVAAVIAALVCAPALARPAAGQAPEQPATSPAGPLDRARELIDRGREAIGLDADHPQGAALTGIENGVPFLVHFEGTVGRLEAGAPVEVLGMRLGEVRRVQIAFDPARGAFDIPVVIELDPTPFVAGSNGEGAAERVYGAIDSLVRRGLRAQLGNHELLPGTKLVRLDMVPNAEAAELSRAGELPEIPVAPTPVASLSATLDTMLAGVAELPLVETLTELRAMLEATRGLAADPALAQTLARLPGLVDQLGALAASLDERMPPLLARLEEVARETPALIERTETALASAQGLLAASDALPGELRALMEELTRAARSTRLLVELLERQPGALLRGRAGERW